MILYILTMKKFVFLMYIIEQQNHTSCMSVFTFCPLIMTILSCTHLYKPGMKQAQISGLCMYVGQME